MSAQHKRNKQKMTTTKESNQLKQMKKKPEVEVKAEQKPQKPPAFRIPPAGLRYDTIYPGRLVAWADGSRLKP